MCMDRVCKFFNRALEFEHWTNFSDQVCGMWTNDMDAQDFPIFRIRYDFDKTTCVVNDFRCLRCGGN